MTALIVPVDQPVERLHTRQRRWECSAWVDLLVSDLLEIYVDDLQGSFKVVKTRSGDLRGFAPDERTWAWYGIPYAAAPVGPLRWRPPVPPQAWSGVRDATVLGDQAAQDPFYKPYGLGGMSEDCLYLNVTAPRRAGALPVMVYFHGGAFVALTCSVAAFNNPRGLPAKGVVLVTVNHRLGPFGYLAHPWLTAESVYGGSGNYGQMDLIAALEWVRDNIAAFGGDPGNVTLFGQSGGGAKALCLMASPRVRGLFHRVICQSGMTAPAGALLDAAALDAAEEKGLDLSRRLRVGSLAALRDVPWQTIVASDRLHYGQRIDTYGPNVDGYYMSEPVMAAVHNGLPGDVPLLAGATAADRVPEADLAAGLQAQMPVRAACCKSPQYVYCFSHVPEGWRALGIQAYHGIDLVYVFNYPEGFVVNYQFGLTGLSRDAVGAGDGHSPEAQAVVLSSTGFGQEDVLLTDRVMTMWTNFARCGDPSIPGEMYWRPYSPVSDAYLDIDTRLCMRTGLAQAFDDGKLPS